MGKIICFILFALPCLCMAQIPPGTLTVNFDINNPSREQMAQLPVTFIETETKERIAKSTDENGKLSIVLNTGKDWSVSIGDIHNYIILTVPEAGIQGSKGMYITYDTARWNREHKPLADRSKMNISNVDQSSVDIHHMADSESSVKLHIYRKNRQPLANFPLNLTCLNTAKTYTSATDEKGNAYYVVPSNNDYEVDIEGIESFQYVLVTQPGNYELEIMFEPTNIKETETHDTIIQDLPDNVVATSTRTLVKMKIERADMLSKDGDDVYLAMIKSKKVYITKTDKNGEAVFLLPNKHAYMLHFNYQKDVDVINLTDIRGIGNQNATFTYMPDPALQYPEKFIPTPNSLLLRDFSSFLTKQFPSPENGPYISLTLNWGNKNVNKNSEDAILEIGIAARKEEPKMQGPPVNIAFVVDKSGSMFGYDRIDKLKEALLNYISFLRPDDIVSLVSFDNEAKLLVPAQPVGDGRFLHDMIYDLKANGGTYIYSGLMIGYEQALSKYISKGTNRVILLTDGRDETPVEKLLNDSKKYNDKGIELSCVGVGQGYNQALLTLLASKGGGLIQFVGNANEMVPAFTNELTNMLSPVAKDASIEIEYNKEIVFKELYGLKYSIKGQGKVAITLDNIYAGLNKVALVKFRLINPTKNIENEPVIIRLKCYDFIKKQMVTIEQKAYLHWDPSNDNPELILESEQKKLYAIAVMNQALKMMADSHETGDDEKAKKTIENVLDQLKKLYPTCNDNDVNQLKADLQKYANAFSQIAMNKGKKK